MTAQALERRAGVTESPFNRARVRRVTTVTLLLAPVLLSAWWAVHDGRAVVNSGGSGALADLAASALRPQLSLDFLTLVARAVATTLAFAALGTAVALALGAAGGLVLSDAAWSRRPGPVLGGIRALIRTALVGARAIHEVVWALLLVSVLGLDPLVAVLALGIPFGAQTARVVADTLDDLDQRPIRALRAGGVRGAAAIVYGLMPGGGAFLASYSFYRFECAVRSAVLLGVVGVGGLGQELVVSLQSRNWDEVWTLVWAVVVVSAVVDLWSGRVRRDMAVVSCTDWSSGSRRSGSTPRPVSTRGLRVTVVVGIAAIIASWIGTGVSLNGLVSPRTAELTGELFAGLFPPALPSGGWPELGGAIVDSLAMAVLAMTIAIGVTLLVGPWAVRPRRAVGDDDRGRGIRAFRASLRIVVRALLLVLRSIPPTVWAIAALLVLFPGVWPGAVALGLYTAGILGRLTAEAWEGIDLRPRDALVATGTSRPLAAIAAMLPPSIAHLSSYGMYRFEICVRDTAVVGVVGAAGLGRLLGENLAFFRFDVVSTLLVASIAISAAVEGIGRLARRTRLGTP